MLSSAAEKKRPRSDTDGVGRLINGSVSGVPGLVLEWFGDHGLACDYGFGDRAGLAAALRDFARDLGWKSMLLVDRRKAGVESREENTVLSGEPPEVLAVREGALRFRVELRHPRNPGLFLDTAELRGWLRAHAGGKSVLNLFAHTGSLGIAALSGGAGAVVQVDVSRRYLDWGRHNLRLNALPEERCRFKTMDAERYLDWAAGRKKKFDFVILDPPVFSRFEGVTFRFERDYFRLVSKSAAVLAGGGTLLAVTNYAGIGSRQFRDGVLETLARSGLGIQAALPIPLPPGFDSQGDPARRAGGNALIYRIETES